MSYHGTVFKNKQLKQLLKKNGEKLENLQLLWIKGKPALRTKNKIVCKENLITVFGSDFVAKLRRYQRKVV